MSIHKQTEKKLFREHFSEKNPIRVEPGKSEELKKSIEKRLKAFDDVETGEGSYYRRSEKAKYILELSILEPHGYGYRNRSKFDLSLDNQRYLVIDGYYSVSAKVSAIDEIISFLDSCRKQIERKEALRIKRNKVREFKTQAILAQIRKLAKEEKLDFCTETDTVKLKLFVKLEENECIELFIPFSKFQKILPNLRSTILSLRELRQQGIKFKIKSVSSHYFRWISHDSL